MMGRARADGPRAREKHESPMFIGHFGVALAAKPVAKGASLGTLFLAGQLLDLLWPLLLLFGLEAVVVSPGATELTPLEFIRYPISHSLLAVVGWALWFATVYFAVRRRLVPALVTGALVVSHWVLDAITHEPDLLLYPGGSTKIGMGLWNHPVPAIVLEAGLFGFGVLLYHRHTVATDKVGALAFWSLVGFLALVYCGNLLGPPPPSVSAVVGTALAQWLLVVWAYWAERHRKVRS